MERFCITGCWQSFLLFVDKPFFEDENKKYLKRLLFSKKKVVTLHTFSKREGKKTFYRVVLHVQ